jgi:hypothetical protein
LQDQITTREVRATAALDFGLNEGRVVEATSCAQWWATGKKEPPKPNSPAFVTLKSITIGAMGERVLYIQEGEAELGDLPLIVAVLQEAIRIGVLQGRYLRFNAGVRTPASV